MKSMIGVGTTILTICLLSACAPSGGVQAPAKSSTPSAIRTPQATTAARETPLVKPGSDTPQAGTAGQAAPLVEWQRSGGIVGRCRHLTIYPDGRYVYTDCLEQNTLSEGKLPADQMAYLSDLAGRYQSFRWENKPPKQSADMFMDWVVFNGAGTETPDDQQMQEIDNQLAIITSKLNSPQASQASGIRGRIVIGPNCPGPVKEGATQCSEQPYQAKLAILDAKGNQVTLVQSNADGIFQVALQPGTYIIRPLSESRFPTAPDQTVTVPAGQFVEVTIQFDSGIR